MSVDFEPELIPATDKIHRRPVFQRHLLRKHCMDIKPPTEEDKRDAILILRDSWLWADELTEEALRVLDEAGQ